MCIVNLCFFGSNVGGWEKMRILRRGTGWLLALKGGHNMCISKIPQDNVNKITPCTLKHVTLSYRIQKFWLITIIFAISGEFSGANLCESLIFSP